MLLTRFTRRSMLKLLDPGTVPPGGFRYLCPETRTWINAASFSELVAAASKHRASNQLGVPGHFKEQVEDQLCITMPPGTCMQNGVARTTGTRELAFADIVSATKTLGEWVLRGMKKVDQKEAERRANICLSCPFNQPHSGCTSCTEKEMRELVMSVIGDSTTPVDGQLHTCHICGCTLRAAIWLPLEILQKHMRKDLEPPDYCWKGQKL